LSCPRADGKPGATDAFTEAEYRAVPIIAISDPADPRLAPYRDVRERDLVGRQGRFVAEGRVVIAAMLEGSLHALESLLILDRRLAGMAELLSALPDDLPVYVAGQDVMDRVAGFHVHRGVLGIGRQGEQPEPAALLGGAGEPALVLAACGIANHDNMGALLRNAAAFGVKAVIIDETCCDPLYRKAIRVSAGHALRVPFARAGGGRDLVAMLQDAGLAVLALSPRAGVEITSVRPAMRTALLVGAEGPGLPPDLIARLPAAHIAMADGIDSLNVAVASAIALHHLSRALAKAG
jgi:tRNA G18 (ribose-2'-O)-methylase SpoU